VGKTDKRKNGLREKGRKSTREKGKRWGGGERAASLDKKRQSSGEKLFCAGTDSDVKKKKMKGSKGKKSRRRQKRKERAKQGKKEKKKSVLDAKRIIR